MPADLGRGMGGGQLTEIPDLELSFIIAGCDEMASMGRGVPADNINVTVVSLERNLGLSLGCS